MAELLALPESKAEDSLAEMVSIHYLVFYTLTSNFTYYLHKSFKRYAKLQEVSMIHFHLTVYYEPHFLRLEKMKDKSQISNKHYKHATN